MFINITILKILLLIRPLYFICIKYIVQLMLSKEVIIFFRSVGGKGDKVFNYCRSAKCESVLKFPTWDCNKYELI
jgi:hypothetical protein